MQVDLYNGHKKVVVVVVVCIVSLWSWFSVKLHFSASISVHQCGQSARSHALIWLLFMSCVYKSACSRCHQKCISFCIVFWWTNHLHTCGIHLDSYYHLVVTEHQRYWGSQSMGCDETLCASGGLLLQHSSGVPPLEIFRQLKILLFGVF